MNGLGNAKHMELRVWHSERLGKGRGHKSTLRELMFTAIIPSLELGREKNEQKQENLVG